MQSNYYLHFFYNNDIIIKYFYLSVVWTLYNSKRWLMPNIQHAEALRISENLNVSLLAANILCARGFSFDDAKSFLCTDNSFFYDPFLLNDMQKAVDRLNIALDKKEKIAVYGDYDVDGITATYILFDYLKSLGADVIYYIPDRIQEGYGMNCGAIDTLKEKQITLIITVDVGITAIDEVNYANENNIDVIITDHHALKDDLPDAVAVINPKITTASYPFDSLAGVGVAFKLIYAHSGMDEDIFTKYCDIVAVGTVADMVALKGENRYIVSKGLKKIKTTDNPGLKAIMTVAGIRQAEITSADISFAIAPRLNAAGRMEKAQNSVELLLETNDKIAMTHAEELDSCNKSRQAAEQKIFDECIEIIERDKLYDRSFILVAKEDWAHGIIGIVSSKITEKYYRPSAVVSINPDGTGKASGRSIKGINLFDALSACSDYLVRFGGHELAAGFTLKTESLEEFYSKIDSYAAALLTEEVSTPSIQIDSVISLSDIELSTAESLEVLEPYGIENRVPVFCVEDVLIEDIRYTQNRKHAFITVSKDGIKREMPAFSMADAVDNFSVGDVISVAGNLGINSFRGNVRAQFIVRDIKHSPLSKKLSYADLKNIFVGIRNTMKNGECILKDKSYINIGNFKKLKVINPKFEIATKIFEEVEILCVTPLKDGYKISKGINFESKTDITLSPTYKKYAL